MSDRPTRPRSLPSASLLQRLVDEASDTLSFTPSADQRRARAAYWASAASEGQGGYSGHSASPDLAAALRFAGDKRVAEWWDTPGFPEWFGNSTDFAQRVEYLAQLALDEIEHILAGTGANSLVVKPTDRLAAAKMVLELGRKFPNSQASGQYLDAKIAEMSRAQLEEYIARSSALLVSATPSSPGTSLLTPPTDSATVEE